jgi:hypothetical protein
MLLKAESSESFSAIAAHHTNDEPLDPFFHEHGQHTQDAHVTSSLMTSDDEVTQEPAARYPFTCNNNAGEDSAAAVVCLPENNNANGAMSRVKFDLLELGDDDDSPNCPKDDGRDGLCTITNSPIKVSDEICKNEGREGQGDDTPNSEKEVKSFPSWLILVCSCAHAVSKILTYMIQYIGFFKSTDLVLLSNMRAGHVSPGIQRRQNGSVMRTFRGLESFTFNFTRCLSLFSL